MLVEAPDTRKGVQGEGVPPVTLWLLVHPSIPSGRAAIRAAIEFLAVPDWQPSRVAILPCVASSSSMTGLALLLLAVQRLPAAGEEKLQLLSRVVTDEHLWAGLAASTSTDLQHVAPLWKATAEAGIDAGSLQALITQLATDITAHVSSPLLTSACWVASAHAVLSAAGSFFLVFCPCRIGLIVRHQDSKAQEYMAIAVRRCPSLRGCVRQTAAQPT